VREDVEIVDRVYRHVTETLGVKDATVGYGGWYVIVFCQYPQDEQFLKQKLDGGFDGIGVIVKRRCM
jgi:hypothetical protein